MDAVYTEIAAGKFADQFGDQEEGLRLLSGRG